MKSLILKVTFWVVLRMLWSGMVCEASPPQGPLPVHNYHPLQGLFLHLPAETVQGLPKGRARVGLDFAESNTFNISSHPETFLIVDLEMARLSLGLDYGVTEILEVGLEIPFLWRYGGFLDPFIEGVESFFGVLVAARAARPQNEVELVIVEKDGTSLSANEEGSGLGDITLRGKLLLHRENPGSPGIALRAALKLPTGDKDLVFGSGHPDFGIGTLLQKSLRAFTLYGYLDVVFPGDPFEPFGWSLRPIVSFEFASEFRKSPKLSLLAQLGFHTSPFQDTGSQALDDGNVFELAAGLSYRIRENLTWKIGAVQNLNAPDSTADFSLMSHLGFQF